MSILTQSISQPFPRDPEDVRKNEIHEQISRRAYELWEQDGRPEGRAEEHWKLAESQILGTSLGP